MDNAEDSSKNNGIKLKGNIALVGFDSLEPSEMIIVKKIVGNYVKRMGNVANYEEMKLVLQQHKHGKGFKHEINALAFFDEGRFNAHVTEWNLYKALSEVCEKILNEIEHMKYKNQSKGIKK